MLAIAPPAVAWRPASDASAPSGIKQPRHEEPAFLPHSLDFFFRPVTGPFPGLPALPALVAASDLVLYVLTMIFSRADRCIHLMIMVSPAAA